MLVARESSQKELDKFQGKGFLEIPLAKENKVNPSYALFMSVREIEK